MKIKRKVKWLRTALTEDWRRPAGAITCALLGLFLLLGTSYRHWFYHASYDWLLILLPANRAINDVLIITCDAETIKELHEDPIEAKNRALWAELTNRLFDHHARAVVFDILFDESGREDLKLAQAISNRNVALVRVTKTSSSPGGPTVTTPTPPLQLFALAAMSHVGDAEFDLDADGVVRRHPAGTNSLSWAVWHMLRVTAESNGSRRWIRFYGKPGTAFPRKSCYQLLDTNFGDDLVANRVVFVGRSGAKITSNGRIADETMTPYGLKADGVEMHATATQNLLNGDWLTEPSLLLESVLIAIWGFSFAVFLSISSVGHPRKLSTSYVARRSLRITGYAVVGMVVLAGLLFWQVHLWLPWTIPLFAQVPCAVAWVAWMALVPAKPRYDAFISYRRSESADFAHLVHDILWEQEGIKSFLDVLELGAGKFGPELLRAIDAAPSFIFIVSPEAFRRCSDPDDWVRQEIRHALKAKKKIVPFLMEKCEMPKHDTLPDDIADFADENGFKYSSDFPDPYIHKLASELKA